MKRIAINGFGRIGRLVLRALIENGKGKDLQVIAINDLGSPESNLHLFKYDSIHGFFNHPTTLDGDTMTVGGHSIKICQEPKPEALPWKDLGIDIVFECSGRFTSKAQAELHLKAGAQKVLISAPANDSDLTVVYGVNHDKITKDMTVISNASCTTNCLGPLAAVLDKGLGIERGFMTTIHAYTGDQRLVDTTHSDMHRARAAALSMIPTSTGAAKAVGLVLPQLKGKIDGTAIRVPTPNVSFVDFKFDAKRATTVEEVNHMLQAAADGPFKSIMSINKEPLVSVDFNHNPKSAIVDVTQTFVMDHTFVRVVAWYDNEWGFSNRMLDTACCL